MRRIAFWTVPKGEIAIPSLLKQVTAFLGVGVFATLCHYLVLIILVEAAGIPVVPASASGALVGAVVGYRLNYTLTFNSNAPHRETAPRYLVIAVIAMVFNTVLMVILHGMIMLPYMVAQVITTGLVFIVTFAGNRLWTFGATRQK